MSLFLIYAKIRYLRIIQNIFLRRSYGVSKNMYLCVETSVAFNGDASYLQRGPHPVPQSPFFWDYHASLKSFWMSSCGTGWNLFITIKIYIENNLFDSSTFKSNGKGTLLAFFFESKFLYLQQWFRTIKRIKH